jgi:CheY-like chemotaxis protein
MRRALGPTVSVVTDFPPGLPVVRSDISQLESALLNLAVNARDAMQHGGRIVISARPVQVTDKIGSLAPGSYVCLCVTDSGEGMDETTLRHAAEPFFTTKGLGHGTGLGLSMVRGLAEQSGGALRLRSEKSKGTNAEIWLPLAQGAAAAAQPVAKKPAAAKQNEQLRVLAVDDDPLVLMNVVDMLEDLGHHVTSVTSGADAIRQLQSEKTFDLLVSDHAMPKMTGAQLITDVMRRWPAMKAMLATGYAELPPGSEVNVPRLSKPFTQDQLADAIARLG